MRILVVNAGSSSLKLRLLGADDSLLASRDFQPHQVEAPDQALWDFLGGLTDVDAVGHRIVHGGTDFTRAVPIDVNVEGKLRALTDLAPLHQPKSLAAFDAVSQSLPNIPAIACFDTSFHATLPEAASTYAIPREWRKRWGIRRYGFHGLSHAYASRRAAELLDRPIDDLRLVTCHLGAGASLAAVEGGRSVDTTMGFTPLDGLVMATRSGSVDPGLVLWLQEHARLQARELADALEHRSGLMALAGTPDMRETLDRSSSGDPDAILAIGVYAHRLRAEIAAMAAAMSGLDAVVFTGGVGEHSPEVRRLACSRIPFLDIDDNANSGEPGDRDISSGGSSIRALVVEAREDLQIAHEVRELLGA